MPRLLKKYILWFHVTMNSVMRCMNIIQCQKDLLVNTKKRTHFCSIELNNVHGTCFPLVSKAPAYQQYGEKQLDHGGQITPRTILQYKEQGIRIL